MRYNLMGQFKRAYNADWVNKVSNDPTVFPNVKVDGIEKIDLTNFVKDAKNVLLDHPDGNILGVNLGNGIYECHQQYLPSKSNKFKLAKEAANYFFQQTEAITLLAKVPKEFPESKVILINLGFKKVGEELSRYFRNGHQVMEDVYILTIEEWRKRCHREQ